MADFRIEMRIGQDMRHVEADHFVEQDGWWIFYQKPPQGGKREYWRVCASDVVSMETKP